MSMVEVGRVTGPVDGATASFTLTPGVETLVIENQLGAVLWAAWGRNPTINDWDFVVPGSALFVLPVLGGQTRLHVLVDYTGAVPAGDVQAIVWGAECNWPPSVGPIA